MPSRGALAACVIPIGIAAVLGGQMRRLVPIGLIAAAMFTISYIGDIGIQDTNILTTRAISAQGLIDDIESVIGTSTASNLDGTKRWRLAWWAYIEDYTFNGPYFWTGKGFGANLAEADGFVVGQELQGAPLRSPHNAHMTILARSGVPGLALWVLVIAGWFGMLYRSMIDARRRGAIRYSKLFLWIACYAIAALIDASADVALEGPMVGIWFWCLFGFGIGSVMIYRAVIAQIDEPVRRFLPSLPGRPPAGSPAVSI
jgi:hypothetical protein